MAIAEVQHGNRGSPSPLVRRCFGHNTVRLLFFDHCAEVGVPLFRFEIAVESFYKVGNPFRPEIANGDDFEIGSGFDFIRINSGATTAETDQSNLDGVIGTRLAVLSQNVTRNDEWRSDRNTCGSEKLSAC